MNSSLPLLRYAGKLVVHSSIGIALSLIGPLSRHAGAPRTHTHTHTHSCTVSCTAPPMRLVGKRGQTYEQDNGMSSGLVARWPGATRETRQAAFSRVAVSSLPPQLLTPHSSLLTTRCRRCRGPCSSRTRRWPAGTSRRACPSRRSPCIGSWGRRRASCSPAPTSLAP